MPQVKISGYFIWYFIPNMHWGTWESSVTLQWFLCTWVCVVVGVKRWKVTSHLSRKWWLWYTPLASGLCINVLKITRVWASKAFCKSVTRGMRIKLIIPCRRQLFNCLCIQPSWQGWHRLAAQLAHGGLTSQAGRGYMWELGHRSLNTVTWFSRQRE